MEEMEEMKVALNYIEHEKYNEALLRTFQKLVLSKKEVHPVIETIMNSERTLLKKEPEEFADRLLISILSFPQAEPLQLDSLQRIAKRLSLDFIEKGTVADKCDILRFWTRVLASPLGRDCPEVCLDFFSLGLCLHLSRPSMKRFLMTNLKEVEAWKNLLKEAKAHYNSVYSQAFIKLTEDFINFFGILNRHDSPEEGFELLTFCETFLNLVISLVQYPNTAPYIRALVQDRNLLPLMKLSKVIDSPIGELIDKQRDLLTFYINCSNKKQDNKWSEENDRLALLFKVMYVHFADRFEKSAAQFSGRLNSRENLDELLSQLSEEEINNFCDLLEIPTIDFQFIESFFDSSVSLSEVYTELILSHYNFEYHHYKEIVESPLYPIEETLWDEQELPRNLGKGQNLALPRLSAFYSCVEDLISRLFWLIRLEAAFGIREDLEKVINSTEKITEKADRISYKCRSKSGIPLSNFRVIYIKPALVGKEHPGQVRAVFELNLSDIDEEEKRKWSNIKRGEVLYLLRFGSEINEENNDYVKEHQIEMIRACEVETLELAKTLIKLNVFLDVHQYKADNDSGKIYNNFQIAARVRNIKFSQYLKSCRNLVLQPRKIPEFLKTLLIGKEESRSVYKKLISAKLSPVTLLEGEGVSGKTQTVMKSIHTLLSSSKSEKILFLSNSNSTILQALAHNPIHERYIVVLGVKGSHRYSPKSRCDYLLLRRLIYLERVRMLAQTLKVQHFEEYTCESAGYLYNSYIRPAYEKFLVEISKESHPDFSTQFVFLPYFYLHNKYSDDYINCDLTGDKEKDLIKCKQLYQHIDEMFIELQEARALEIIRDPTERENYIIMHQSRLIASTAKYFAQAGTEGEIAKLCFTTAFVDNSTAILPEQLVMSLILPGLQRLVLIGDKKQGILSSDIFRKFAFMNETLFDKCKNFGVIPEKRKAFSSKIEGVLKSQWVNIPMQKNTEKVNLEEAEFSAAAFGFLCINKQIPPQSISILCATAAQKNLIKEIISVKFIENKMIEAFPKYIKTIFQAQGLHNEYVICSTVHSKEESQSYEIRKFIPFIISSCTKAYLIFGLAEVFLPSSLGMMNVGPFRCSAGKEEINCSTSESLYDNINTALESFVTPAKRIQQEVQELKRNPIPNCHLLLGRDVFNLRIQLHFTDNSPFSFSRTNTEYIINLLFPANYPLSTPKLQFLTPIEHSSVLKDGSLLLDTLNLKWNSGLTIRDIILAVFAFFEKCSPQQ